MHSNVKRALLLLTSIMGLSLAAAAEPVIFDAVDENPQPMRTPPPAYPRELLAQKVSGMVVLEVVVDDMGKVTQADVVKSTESAFNAPSVEAVKRWRFRAAKKDGEKVWVRFKLPMKFAPEA